MLDALKAQYKIVLPDGSVYGKLEEKPAKTAKPARPNKHMRKYAFGETCAYYKPFLFCLKPDDVALIPYDRFKGTILAGNVSSYANTLFGAGNYTVHNDKEAKLVEVWRFK